MADGGSIGLRGRRRAVTLDAVDVMQQSYLVGRAEPPPLVLTPATSHVDLAEWSSLDRDIIDGCLTANGAVLFRGFGLTSVADFERVASAIAPDLYAGYGDLPPEKDSERVYGSTPYPADARILFHNESSHLAQWPMKQFFFSVIPAVEGGETPILDCRRVCERLDPDVLAAFETKGLRYVRNFLPGIDVGWREFFKTDDVAAVEARCQSEGMTCEWTEGDGLRVTNAARAVARHPKTGDKVFFNQVQLHHPACLDPGTRESLLELLGEDQLPRNVRYGDGAPIPDEVMAHVGEVFDELAVGFPWQAGDLLMLDNMLISHSRNPFRGPRKVVVAMAEMFSE